METWSKWNSLSRIGVQTGPEGGGMIYIDADASTGIADFDFRHTGILSSGLRPQLISAARPARTRAGAPLYTSAPGAKALVIGPGGGWDVSRALASGSHDITAVEINPIIATTIMREKFADESQGLYLRPDVHVYVEDGRSFVRRSHR